MLLFLLFYVDKKVQFCQFLVELRVCSTSYNLLDEMSVYVTNKHQILYNTKLLIVFA